MPVQREAYNKAWPYESLIQLTGYSSFIFSCKSRDKPILLLKKLILSNNSKLSNSILSRNALNTRQEGLTLNWKQVSLSDVSILTHASSDFGFFKAFS